MRAVLCHAFEGPPALTVGEAPEPALAADEVLISVHFASVSFMDLLMISGGYQKRPKLPYTPGTDAAGIVAAVGGEVEHFRPGDRVIGTGWHGAYAERMAVKSWRCNRLPDGLDMATASTVAHAYATAHYSLIERARLAAGETLLVTGAAGGVGLAAVDMGRMLGARVIACVGDAAKAQAPRDHGAAEIVVIGQEDLRTRVLALTGGRGVDVAFDLLGGETFLTLARTMAWGGRLLPIGFTSGTIPSLPMNLPLLKNYSVVGVFAGAWLDAEPAAASRAVDEVLHHVAVGRLHPRVDRVLPLESATEALNLVAERAVQGRVVLSVGGSGPDA